MKVYVRSRVKWSVLDAAFKRLARQAIAQRKYLTHAQLIERFGSSKEDLDAVEEYASKNKICVRRRDPGSQIVELWGLRSDFSRAFRVNWMRNRKGDEGFPYRRMSPIYVPKHLKDIITHVSDVSDPPLMLTRVRAHAASKSLRARQIPMSIEKPLTKARWTGKLLAQYYRFPAKANGKPLDGTGQTVALIELGQGYQPRDVDKYFKALNLPTPKIVAASVEGGKNSWHSTGGEVITDIDVVGAVVPGARIVVYFGDETTAEELYKIVSTAVLDSERKPSVISISWGWPEHDVPKSILWGMNHLFKKAALLGITICVASGDNGSLDMDPQSAAAELNKGKLNVDFPACLEASLACGGTWITSKGEVTWNEGNGIASGGGVSEIIPRPTYQNRKGVPTSPEKGFKGRGVPDVLGIAVNHLTIQNGKRKRSKGTSFVAPLWAGLIILLNQALGKPVGFVNPILYDNRHAFKIITCGHNDIRERRPTYQYEASRGWDPATGLGVPKGRVLLQVLKQKR
jgi:kumamolisin